MGVNDIWYEITRSDGTPVQTLNGINLLSYHYHGCDNGVFDFYLKITDTDGISNPRISFLFTVNHNSFSSWNGEPPFGVTPFVGHCPARCRVKRSQQGHGRSRCTHCVFAGGWWLTMRSEKVRRENSHTKGVLVAKALRY